MPKKKASSRIARVPFHCTVCGGKLPESLDKWGLVWDGAETGICSDCLHEIRLKIGYYKNARNKRNRSTS